MPGRAVWKGTLTFGLVSIPIALYTAVKEKTPTFKLLHSKCNTPLKYHRYCEHCDKIVPWEETVKGYEIKKGEYVVLSDEDFERVPLETVKKIEILSFVNHGEIDPIYFDAAYQIAPLEGGEEAYILLSEAMRELERVAIGKIAIHEKEHLVMIRNYQDILLLQTMHWPDELKEIEIALPKIKINKEEIKIAKQLIEAKAKPFIPDEYKDEYREALEQLIKAKAEGKTLPPLKLEVKKAKNLMKLLRESVEAEKKRSK
jgi:DNA end-binding protein Ku